MGVGVVEGDGGMVDDGYCVGGKALGAMRSTGIGEEGSVGILSWEVWEGWCGSRCEENWESGMQMDFSKRESDWDTRRRAAGLGKEDRHRERAVLQDGVVRGNSTAQLAACGAYLSGSTVWEGRNALATVVSHYKG